MGDFFTGSGAGIVGGLSGFAQSLINRKNDALNQARQQKYNLELADYNNQMNIRNWNMQNEYNSPAQQMQRFRDANLNPNLMYGQGSPGNASTLPNYQQAGVDKSLSPLNLMGTIGAYQDIKLKQAQVNNTEAQGRIINAEGTIKENEAIYAKAFSLANLYKLHKEGAITAAEYEKHKLDFWAEWGGKLDDNYIIDTDNKGYYLHGDMPKFDLDGYGQAGERVLQKRDLMKSSLMRSQADARSASILSGMREGELDFIQSGGKFFNPILRAFGLIFGR